MNRSLIRSLLWLAALVGTVALGAAGYRGAMWLGAIYVSALVAYAVVIGREAIAERIQRYRQHHVGR